MSLIGERDVCLPTPALEAYEAVARLNGRQPYQQLMY